MKSKSAVASLTLVLFAVAPAWGRAPRLAGSDPSAPLASLLIPTATLVAGGADDCAALHTSAGSGSVAGVPFTTGTTGTTGQNESLCLAFGQSGIANDVWFDWTATVTGSATFATCGGTAIDTKAAIWPDASPGSCPSDGTALACIDDACGVQTEITWPTVAGHRYTIQLGTFPGAAGGSGSFGIAQNGPPPIGTPLCFGDGSGSPCPCGNEGPAGAGGCTNSSGTGAFLTTTSSTTYGLALSVTDAPPSTGAILFQGNQVVNGGAGTPLYDGLRCCGTSVVRIATFLTDSTGTGSTDGSSGTPFGFDPPIDVACESGALPGDLRCYQLWFCDAGSGPCGTAYNYSNAVTIVWDPNLILGNGGDCTLEGGVTEPCEIAPAAPLIQEPGALSCPPLAPNDCAKCGAVNGMPIVRRASGELQLVETDARLDGLGVPFLWQRQYRSRSGPAGASGLGTAASYDVKVVADGADRLLYDGQGRVDRYVAQPDGTWVAAEFQRVLRTVAGVGSSGYELEFQDTGTWQLAPLDGSPTAGKLQGVVTRNGDVMQLAYDGSGKLSGVTDALGRSASMQYDVAGRVLAVTDPVGRTTSYAYYGAGDPNGPEGALRSVTTPPVTGTPNGNDFPSGKTTVYTYTTGFADARLNGDLLTITDPKGQIWLRNEYAHTVPASDPRHTTNPAALDFDRLVRQTLGDVGDVIDFFYESVVPDAGNGFAVLECIENDRVGNVTETWFDAMNREVRRREWTGRANPDQYTSSTVNRPTGKLRPSDPDYFETRTEYNALGLPTRIVEPNGNETRFVYEIDLDPQAPARTRGNLRETHRLPGSLGGTQAEIVELFEYDVDHGGCCGSNFVTRYVDGNGNQTLHDYDAQGNRIHTTYPIAGVEEDFEYDASGRMTAHVHPDDGTGHRRRDESVYYTSGPQAGYLQAEIVDATGLALATVYEYDAAGNVIRQIDPLGRDRLSTYNALDQVVRTRSPEVTPGGIRYVEDTFYDANDNVVRVERDNLDEDGVPGSPAKLATSYEFEVLNFVARQSSDVGPSHQVVTEYAYDANRNRVLTRSPEAVSGGQPTNETAMVYDERDLLYRTVRAPSDAAHSTTQFDYDGNRNQVAVRSGLEASPRVTTMEYDGYGQLVRATDPMGNVSLSTFDANGNLVGTRRDGELLDAPGSSGNLRLAETTSTFDALNRRIREDAAFFDPATQAPYGDGARTHITEFAPDSQIVRTIDDHGHATVYVYDGAWRLASTTDAKGNVRMRSYDAASNLVATTDVELSDTGAPAQSFTTTHGYDGLDRLVLVTDPIGGQRRMRFDSRGNRVLEIDELGHETRSVYDGLDRLTATVIDLDGDGARQSDADDVVLARLYDENSRLTGQVDDNGNATQYDYDALDRHTRIRYADGTEDLTGYDVHGDPVSSLDANGTALTTLHDLDGRATLVTVQPGTGVATDTTFEAYAYDGLSRLVRAQDDDSLVTRAYDSLSNLRLETQNGDPVQDLFDAEGDRLQCLYPSGRAVGCTYDQLDRPKSLSDPGGSLAAYDYVGPDRVEERANGNGTRLEFSFDGLRRVSRTRHTRTQDGAVIDDRMYLWDPVGNKLQRKDVRLGGPGFTHDYEYDRAYRLVHTRVSSAIGATVRETSYELDGAGNRKRVLERAGRAGAIAARPEIGSYTMDPRSPEPADGASNQYSTTPFDRRTYDSTGGLVRTIDRSSAEAVLVYDHRHRLVSFAAGGRSTASRYDVFGRIIESTVDDGAGAVTLRRLFDDWQVIEERSAGGTVTASWVYGNYVDEPLAMLRGGGNYYYHQDDLYSVTALTDASGTIVERYEFQDFGSPTVFDPAGLELPRTAVANPYLFTGREYWWESALYSYRARFLEPLTGRFVSRDPLGPWGDGANLGNAVTLGGNNPLSVVDPFGQESVGFYRAVPTREEARRELFPGRTSEFLSEAIINEAVDALIADRSIFQRAAERTTDYPIAIDGLDDAYDKLAALNTKLSQLNADKWWCQRSKKVSELYFFAHGVPGHIILGRTQSDVFDVQQGTTEKFVKLVKLMGKGGVIHFRSCYFANDSEDLQQAANLTGHTCTGYGVAVLYSRWRGSGHGVNHFTREDSSLKQREP